MSRRGRGPASDRYTCLPVRVWDDLRMGGLSAEPAPATLYVWLAAGPLTSRVPGVVVGGPLGIAEALGWAPEACGASMTALEAAGVIVVNRIARIVYLPNMLVAECSKPASPSTAAMWRREIMALPVCELRDRILADARGVVAALGQSWLTAFDSGRDPQEGKPKKQLPDQSGNQGGNQGALPDWPPSISVSGSISGSIALTKREREPAAPVSPSPVISSSQERDRTAEAAEVINYLNAKKGGGRPFKVETWQNQVTGLLASYTAEDCKAVIGAVVGEAKAGGEDKKFLLAPSYWAKPENFETVLSRAPKAKSALSEMQARLNRKYEDVTVGEGTGEMFATDHVTGRSVFYSKSSHTLRSQYADETLTQEEANAIFRRLTDASCSMWPAEMFDVEPKEVVEPRQYKNFAAPRPPILDTDPPEEF